MEPLPGSSTPSCIPIPLRDRWPGNRVTWKECGGRPPLAGLTGKFYLDGDSETAMANSQRKSTKLTFKGDKKEKKHRKRKREGNDDLDGLQDSPQQTEGWLNSPTQAHISGPLYMICVAPCLGTSSDPKPCALAIVPSPLSPIARVIPMALSSQALETLDPDDVNHVMVCTRVVDSSNKVTLRVANGRYLACDELGSVSAEREARGAQEEWIFEAVRPSRPSSPGPSSNPQSDQYSPDGLYVLKSVLYNTYLTVEEVANGKLEIRCDSSSSDDSSSHLLVRMQAAELIKSKKRLAEEHAKKGLLSKSNNTGLTILKAGQTISDLEANNIRQYQARGAGRLITPSESNAGLKKACKEGRLAEELLDRRAKLKSDRYAK
ncbi:hypothetical protein O181_020600 [Austropuccinia psidii MF-1]|uniref:Protein FRG1 n=1 Tax=Austropuccinia psidii MF-1 TaxID=1389203 RepID=A0A9Q3CE30_9BASI|nr:hypothetical protein [Austropuccinia psidii MF-1]